MPIDRRAFKTGTVSPPAPLPYVCKGALKQVRDALPPPTECPFCQGPVRLIHNSEIYGRAFGRWPYAYACTPCNAYVGVHPNTDIPLGYLANGATRKARKLAKEVFYHLLQYEDWSRKQGYRWLRKEMGIPGKECHFGMFNERQCELAMLVCHIHMETN